MSLPIFSWDEPAEARRPGVYTNELGHLLVYTDDGTLYTIWAYNGAEIFDRLAVAMRIHALAK